MRIGHVNRKTLPKPRPGWVAAGYCVYNDGIAQISPIAATRRTVKPEAPRQLGPALNEKPRKLDLSNRKKTNTIHTRKSRVRANLFDSAKFALVSAGLKQT